jgi:hypothetical protein
LGVSINQQRKETMNTYEVIVYDEVCGGMDKLTVQAKTIDQVIYIVESNPKHEYEIIEIEKV